MQKFIRHSCAICRLSPQFHRMDRNSFATDGNKVWETDIKPHGFKIGTKERKSSITRD